MHEVYNNLRLTALTAEEHKRTCGYWYTVTTYGCTAHTAFETEKGLKRWATERGLRIEKMPDADTHETKCVEIVGQYAVKTHMDINEFNALTGIVCKTKSLSNGEYVQAFITAEEGSGHRTVHMLNPNVRERPVFEYFTTMREMR